MQVIEYLPKKEEITCKRQILEKRVKIKVFQEGKVLDITLKEGLGVQVISCVAGEISCCCVTRLSTCSEKRNMMAQIVEQ